MKLKDFCKSALLRLTVAVCCLLGGLGVAAAQSMLVSGTVTSAADGEPLIGVTVMVKNSKVGTATDIDGNYSIEAQKGSVLVFS
ncbi:MAG: carboxypeptidase-like regulatory domain-containing protein, partial [Muribaculaceae bacterium]|nr:carboxypeptidase-like regulatory domain-containing protein [Muribaculaceae bacterium]